MNKAYQQIHQLFEAGIPFCRDLGMKILQLDAEKVQILLPFSERLIGDPRRPALHGGVISTLLDTAGGAIAMTTIDMQQETISTVDMRVDYLLPGRSLDLIGEAVVVRKGNKVIVTNMRAFHADAPQAYIAESRAVYNISALQR